MIYFSMWKRQVFVILEMVILYTLEENYCYLLLSKISQDMINILPWFKLNSTKTNAGKFQLMF